MTDEARRNHSYWDSISAGYQRDYAAERGEPAGAGEDDGRGLYWGWPNHPERELQVLGDVAGRDVLEYGCGAAQWSIALARRGARPVGLDLSGEQLRHARRLMAAAGVHVPLVQADAARAPLRDASFDIVFCEYGAMSFADPYRTVPEAARLLRPGGLLAFVMNSPILEICWPMTAETADERLQVDYFGLHRLSAPTHTEYQLPYGEWIRLLRANGFVIEDLIELQTPAEHDIRERFPGERAWGRRWPLYHIWKARKQA
jgi:SAM-dependent methyltransferase